SVASLSVATNASGETYTSQGGLFSQVLISSAGYVGSMIFGALLLVLIRKAVAARIVLLCCAIYIFGLTMIFGLIKPIFWIQAWSGIPFTLLAGLFISAGLFLIARFASAKVATFFVSFLAVQCVLNALYDLKTVFFLSNPFGPTVPTDAVNMAQATHVPAIFWTLIWIMVALGILWFAMRFYVAGRDKSYQPDLPFEEPQI
ncbi:MAG TPA: M50 family metallopeptidase, partial [Pyrinomonadaceae bacterium]|nr:M50 family metallopeptidase [Pyrinomonadaceae bacterium]